MKTSILWKTQQWITPFSLWRIPTRLTQCPNRLSNNKWSAWNWPRRMSPWPYPESQTWDRQTDAQWDAYLRDAHGPPAYTLPIRVLGDTFTPLAVWNRDSQTEHFEETIIIIVVSLVVHFIFFNIILLPWMDGVGIGCEWNITLDFGIWPMMSTFVVIVDED